MPCLLVESKCDLLPPEERENTRALKEFADKNEYAGAFRVSSKEGININESMQFLIQTIVDRMEGINKTEGKEVFTTQRKNVQLDKQNHATNPSKEKKKKDNCC